MPFTISARENKLVISTDQIAREIPPSQALKEGLWILKDQEIKSINLKDDKGQTITLSDLSESDVKTIRNFISENIL
jgi:hypothetical protein